MIHIQHSKRQINKNKKKKKIYTRVHIFVNHNKLCKPMIRVVFMHKKMSQRPGTIRGRYSQKNKKYYKGQGIWLHYYQKKKKKL